MAFMQVVLGLLSGGPAHGYDLKAAFENQIEPIKPLNFGQVYTTLDRLQREGLVRHAVVPQAERPDKKVYSLTTKGRNRLRAWLNAPSSHDRDLRTEAFLKLMLALRIKDVSPKTVLGIERRACMARLAELSRAKLEAERTGATVQTRALLEWSLLRMEAFAKWLDLCESLIQEASSHE